MNQEERLIVYQSQTANVRALNVAMREIHRTANYALRRNNKVAVETLTKTYALLFCSWAEANFSKTLHTPHGFSLGEIAQVQTAKTLGISTAWKSCVRLGARHLDARRGSFQPNALQRLNELIDRHVFDPTLLRNKLAHGQWAIALNRDHTAVQSDLTAKIGQLDVVMVASWIRAHEILASAIETLIESPKRTFVRDWYQFVVDIEQEAQRAADHTLADHIERLKAKDQRTSAERKRSGQ